MMRTLLNLTDCNNEKFSFFSTKRILKMKYTLIVFLLLLISCSNSTDNDKDSRNFDGTWDIYYPADQSKDTVNIISGSGWLRWNDTRYNGHIDPDYFKGGHNNDTLEMHLSNDSITGSFKSIIDNIEFVGTRMD